MDFFNSTTGSLLGRRAMIAAGLTCLVRTSAIAVPTRYSFDHSGGDIAFTAHCLGFLTVRGQFGGFHATCLLDQADPSAASIAVVVDTRVISVPYPGAEGAMLSAAYLDAETYPSARFHGTATGVSRKQAFALEGELEIRGITHPFSMQATLISRGVDPIVQAEMAELFAVGTLSRSAYGMVADQFAIEDAVEISVRVLLQIG